MKELKKADKTVMKMIPEKFYTYSGHYTLSKFCYFYSVQDSCFLVNTFTLEILILTLDEYKTLLDGNFKDLEKNRFLNYLWKHLFIVNQEIDETREYHKIVKTLDLLADHSSEINHFTIFPTTVCNARCFYCFESSYQPVTLSDEQVNQLIEYMVEKRGDKPLKLMWFGGEPLCGINQIRKICKALNEKNIPFESKMISNGSLFDENIIREAIEDWHLYAIQITFDGKEEQYNHRKNYYSLKDSPFFKVVKNVVSMHKAGLKIILRLNGDLDNIDDLKDLVDYFDTLFETKDRLMIYTFPLFGENNKDSFALLTKRCQELNQYIRNLGYQSAMPIRFSRFRINYCKAALNNNLVVGADGNFYACHSIDTKPFGNVAEGITDKALWKEWKKPGKGKECCQDCVFLPLCTDYPHCPQSPVYPACKISMELKMKQALSNYSEITEDNDLSSFVDEE